MLLNSQASASVSDDQRLGERLADVLPTVSAAIAISSTAITMPVRTSRIVRLASLASRVLADRQRHRAYRSSGRHETRNTTRRDVERRHDAQAPNCRARSLLAIG